MLPQRNTSHAMSPVRLRQSSRNRIAIEAVKRTGRSTTEMLGLEDLEIGLIFWAEEDALKTLRKAKAFGVRTGQIGFPGDLPLEGAAEKCDDALTAENFVPVTAVCSYVGEDYADIPTVAR